jgi:hypothetical protein
MATVPSNARDLALTVVERFVPAEGAVFDQMWEDFLEDPDETRPVGSEQPVELPHGSGFADAGNYLWSVVIIPVVVAVAKDKLGKAVDVIIEYVRNLMSPKKKAPPPVGDEQIRKLAAIMVEVFDEHAKRSRTVHDNGQS